MIKGLFKLVIIFFIFAIGYEIWVSKFPKTTPGDVIIGYKERITEEE